MRIISRVLLSGMLMLCISASARADVIYSFTGGPGQIFGQNLSELSFTYISPGFVTALPETPASSLASCTSFTGYTCNWFQFIPDYANSDVVLLGSIGQYAIDVAFYFPDGAFSAVGEYDSPATYNPGHLSVQVAAVPEPTSLMLMLSGVGVLGTGLFRRPSYLR